MCYVHTPMHGIIGAHISTYLYRQEVDIRYLNQLFSIFIYLILMYFETWSLTKTGTHQFIYTSWPMSSRSLPVPALSKAMDLCATPCLNFMFIVVIQIQSPMLAHQLLSSAKPSLHSPCTVFCLFFFSLYFINLCPEIISFGLLLFFQVPKAHH